MGFVGAYEGHQSLESITETMAKSIRTSNVAQEVEIRMGKEGIAAAPPQTVMDLWDAAVENNGDRPALHHKIVKKVHTQIILDNELHYSQHWLLSGSQSC